jgi:FkbM family methyltransferase
MIVSVAIKHVNGRIVNFVMDIDGSWPPDRDLNWYLQQQRLPEAEIVEVMLRALRPGDVAVDGGACQGFFTVLMAQLVGKEGAVYSFEPYKESYRRLRNNVKKNNVEDSTVLMKNPLWYCPEMVSISFADHPGQHSIVRNGDDSLEAATLDMFFRSSVALVPRLIKLDVEGSEQYVMMGAEKMLQRHPPYIVAELNEAALAKYGFSQQSFRHTMSEFGYEPFFLREGVFPTHIPANTKVVSDGSTVASGVGERVNTMLLFSTLDDVGALWPELNSG